MRDAGDRLIDRYTRALSGNDVPQRDALTQELRQVQRRRGEVDLYDQRAVRAAYWEFTIKEALPLPGAG